jgi:hypothetical protein
MRSEGLRRIAIATATIACFALGAAGALRVVGWSNLWGGGADGVRQPIAFDDYPLQFYYGQLGGHFLNEGGVTYGYDPNFLAGYPKTPIYYPSSKIFEASFALFPAFDPGSVFNFSIFFMIAALPIFMYGAASNFGLSPWARVVAAAMSTAPHLMVPISSFYPIMEAAGMLPYVFATFLSVFVVSLVWRFLATGERRAGLALLAVAPLLYGFHPTAAVITVVPIAISYLLNFRAAPLRRHAWLWGVLLAIVIANWPWIEGYLLFSHYRDFGDFYTTEGTTQFAPKGGLLAPLYVYVPAPKFVSLLPVLFGVIGLWRWRRTRSDGLLAVFVPQIALLFVVAFYGGLLGMSAIGPARITLPLGLYLFFPAADAMASGASRAFRWLRRNTPDGLKPVALVVAFVVLASAVPLSGLSKSFWRPFTLPNLEKREGFTEHGMALIEWLRKNTDSSGRILHEETSRDTHQYYGTHMPALIPYYAGREMAGGPAPHALIKHNFLRFIAGTLRGKPIQSFDGESLSAYLSLYNVRWVMCWKRSTKRYFNRLPLAVHVSNFDKFALYRIESPPSYFLRGTGTLEVQGQKIILRDLQPDAGEVAIKYHWLESLRSDPPGRIERLFVLDDPIPFISLKNPPSEVVIFNDFDHGLWSRNGDEHESPDR